MENEQQLNHLKQLVNFPAWQFFKDDLKAQLKAVESDIFKINPEDNEKVYTKKDVLRLERNILQMMIKLPDDLMEKLDQIIEEDQD